MSIEYNSLQALLQANNEAMRYYDSLPMNVRENISERAKHVNSFEDLKAFAANMVERLN